MGSIRKRIYFFYLSNYFITYLLKSNTVTQRSNILSICTINSSIVTVRLFRDKLKEKNFVQHTTVRTICKYSFEILTYDHLFYLWKYHLWIHNNSSRRPLSIVVLYALSNLWILKHSISYIVFVRSVILSFSLKLSPC